MVKSVCPRYCPLPFCIAVCPAGAIFTGGDRNIHLDLAKCHGCGICRIACITFSRDKALERKMPWLSATRS